MRLNNITAIATLLSAGLLLGGCGGSSNDSANQGAAMPTEDAFITTVKVQTDGANASSDEAEPVDIMAVNATSPEETEPQIVVF